MSMPPGICITPRPGRRGARFGLALALAFSLVTAASAAAPAASALSKDDIACLACHASAIEKTLANGEQLSLRIPVRNFASSVHASSGCEACHSDLAAGHDKRANTIASRRAFALARMEACRDCHGKTMKQYEDSVHSALVRTGSEKAPLCTDCHDPHSQRSSKEQGSGQVQAIACQKCHGAITQAFADSVHGKGGDEALVCKDCHRTHDIRAAGFGDRMQTQCLSCHKDAAATHAKWLPNTERHLEAISCAACHSPGATRRVDLRLYEGGAPQQGEKVGVPTFVQLTEGSDAAGGLDSRALWSLLQEFNRGGTSGKTVLRGRLEVQTGVQAHQLAGKAAALRDCDTCHRQGAASFRSVTVSMAGPDGRPLRRDAANGVLTSIESVGAIGGFYTIGSSRIKLLDALLLLSLAAGICIPGAHLMMKLYFKRRAARDAARTSGTEPDKPRK
jgi:hypothetical protein